MTATVETQPSEAPSGGKVPLVELKNVGKSYGNVHALRGVNLEVYAGEVTCVLGDNGAGKSTLIKIIAGLHKHDAGTFSIFGEPRHLNSPREALDAGIAAVYQDLAVVCDADLHTRQSLADAAGARAAAPSSYP